MIDAALVDAVKAIAADAADRILEVYDSAFAVELKDDRTPLTEADLAAHRAIVAGLERVTPATPILSEESERIPFEVRRQWERYWLVDPLDGTREFIKRNGEFTVNIALIENGCPTLGVVWIPVRRACYYATAGQGAFRQQAGAGPVAISVRRLDPEHVALAGSRSHSNPPTRAFIDRLRAKFTRAEIKSIGSSLKFCLVAEGSVDVYPRFGPTSEWDTAAAQCVVEAAGGHVTDLDLQPLRYNTKASYLNPFFLVFGDDTQPWLEFAA